MLHVASLQRAMLEPGINAHRRLVITFDLATSPQAGRCANGTKTVVHRVINHSWLLSIGASCSMFGRDFVVGGEDVVDPFNEITPFAGGGATDLPLSPMKSSWPLDSQNSQPSTPKSQASGFDKEVHGERYGENGGEMVAGFDEKVFDAAEKSIKYLVMTNTWRKMVSMMKEGSPRTSEETLS